jgi:hypothetical protein
MTAPPSPLLNTPPETRGEREDAMSELTTDELVALLASAPDQLDAGLATVAAQEPAPPSGATGEDAWTRSEIIGHLCDAARYWGARMRLAVHEETPQLEVFDQDAFVRLAAYRYVPVDALAREFRLVNEANVAFLRALQPAQWARSAIHPQRGRLSVREMVEIEAGHELGHAQSFAREA